MSWEMKMKHLYLIFAFFALFLAVSCDGPVKFEDSPEGHSQTEEPKEAGTLGGECYKNQTCNSGLICDEESNTCMKEPGNPTDTGDTEPTDTGDTAEPTDTGDTAEPDGDSGDTTEPDGDTGEPEYECGNRLLEPGEVCDGGATECSSIDPGYIGGYAVCKPDCSGWNVSNCSGEPEPTDTDAPEPDEDSGDTTEPDGDTGDTDPLSEDEICAAAGGTYDYFAEDDFERCWKIVDCAPKPANTEWRGDQSYIEYFDFDDGLWTNFGANYKTEYGDTGEAKICQYVCAANAVREDGTCKPYCSAFFDGSAKIEVAHNDLLNLNYNSGTWTIEAWIKQGEGDIPTYVIHPIVRKGITSDPVYVLSGYYKQQTGNGYGMTSYVKYSYGTSTATGNRLDLTVTYSDDWTHVAMVKNATSGSYQLLLFVNGTLVGSKDFESTPTIVTNNEVLSIGANLSTTNRYFKGLIDSIRISNTAKYTAEFTPGVLSADSDTVAFWDFSGNANDSSGNGLDGSATNVTYSTDCKPLPECSTSNTGPCYDSTSHLTWSKKADTTYNWSDAGTYCDGLSEGGYTDWRLPTISELRTLIKNCSRNIMPGGTCGVRDDDEVVCLSEDCLTSETCASCSYDSTGGYSKFGETGYFWSSSTYVSYTNYAWYVLFSYGYVGYSDKTSNYYVRCVR